MHSVKSTFFAVLASSAVVNADFYILQTVASNPPTCVGEAGCTPVPASKAINVIGTNDFDNCDALGDLSGGGPYNWADPVCPGDGQEGGQPFSATGPACGLTDPETTWYFRVQASNPGQLDAATDSDFSNIVANCYKSPGCGDFGVHRCSTPASYTAEYQCGPLNGSGC